MSSRRKQSKPIGLVEPTTNGIASAAPGVVDEASSSSSASSNTVFSNKAVAKDDVQVSDGNLNEKECDEKANIEEIPEAIPVKLIPNSSHVEEVELVNVDKNEVHNVHITGPHEEEGISIERNALKRKRMSSDDNENEGLFVQNDFNSGYSEDCNEFSQDEEENDDEENEDDYVYEDKEYDSVNNLNSMYMSQNKRQMYAKSIEPMQSEQTPHLLNAIHSTIGERSPNTTNEDMVTSMLLMFKCKVCGKGFKHRRSLNRHVKLHSGEKNFHCPYCSTAFARSDHLKAHIRTHNNSKPFRCSICQCGYSTQAALKVHIAHHHSKSKFKCVICNDMEFHSQLALEGHIYKIHSKENTELDLDHNDKSDPQMTLVTSRMNKNMTRQLNYNISHDDQISATNFNNSYNRVQFADINNHQNEPSDDFFDENEVHYEGNHPGFTVINENEEESLIEYGDELNASNEMRLEKGFDHDNELLNSNEERNKNFTEDDILMEKMARENVDRSIIDIETATIIDNYGEDDDDVGFNDKLLNGSKADEHQLICDENDNNEIMIEESLSTEKSVHKASLEHKMNHPVPKISPRHPHMNNISNPHRFKPPTLLPGSNVARAHANSRPHTQSHLNTYCEMCNARFSNVESFIAHMKNCHPNIPYRQYIQNDEAEPSSYLSSVCKGDDAQHKRNPNQITPVVSKQGTVNPNFNCGIIIPLNNGSIHQKNPCSIPNCNCHLSGKPHKAVELDNDSDLFTKETHYTCGKCNVTHSKISDYISHLKQEHCVEVFRCVLCKQMQLFDNLNLLKDHFFQVHQSVKTDFIRCKLCPPDSGASSLFSNMEKMNSHMQQMHNSGASHGNRTLNMHLRMPVGEIPRSDASSSFQVSQSFSNGSSYRISLNNSKCFKCTYCDSDFAQQSSLNQHIHMVHKKPSNFNSNNQVSASPSTFSCQYCRNTFTNRQQLERHVRIHVSSIDLKCNICDKQFNTQEALSQHKLTHCKTFNSNSSLTHKMSHSESRVPEQTFDSSTVAAQTNKSAICVYCKQTIEDETQFKEHFKRHNNIGQNNQQNKVNSFICIVCRQTLSSNSEYNLHMRHHLRRASGSFAQDRNTSPLNNKSQSPDKLNEINSSNFDLEKKDDDSKDSQEQVSKLRCSKCHVKFEAWQELADHISRAHPNEENPQKANAAEANNGEVIKEITTSDVKSEKIETTSDTSVSKGSELISQMSPKRTSNSNFELCEICSAKFDSNYKLQAHLLIKHEFGNTNGIFTCPVCDESYSRPENLLAHANVHGHAARIYKCTQCTLAFVFKSQLINHSFSHKPAQQIQSLHNKNQQPGNFQGPRQQHQYSKPNHLINVINNRNQIRQSNYNNASVKRDSQIPINARARVLYPSPKTHTQRFRCTECNQVFESFKSYQIHNQTYHNRTVVLNHGVHSNMQRNHGSNRPVGGFHNSINSNSNGYFNGHIPGNMTASSTSST